MSRSVHTSRAKFRKAALFEYSSNEERHRVLGKIVDEVQLKRDLKEDARRKKQSAKAGIRSTTSTSPLYAVASKRIPASLYGKSIAKLHPKEKLKH